MERNRTHVTFGSSWVLFCLVQRHIKSRFLTPSVHAMKSKQEHGGDDEGHSCHQESCSVITRPVNEET